MRTWSGYETLGWSGHRKPFSEIELPPETVSDAVPSVDHPKYAELDPDADRRARVQRVLVQTVLVGVFLAGSGAALLDERGLAGRVRLSRQLEASQLAVAEQRERVVALRAAVEGLKHNPSSRERIAREQLGLALPGEVLFLLQNDKPDAVGLSE